MVVFTLCIQSSIHFYVLFISWFSYVRCFCNLLRCLKCFSEFVFVFEKRISISCSSLACSRSRERNLAEKQSPRAGYSLETSDLILSQIVQALLKGVEEGVLGSARRERGTFPRFPRNTLSISLFPFPFGARHPG